MKKLICCVMAFVLLLGAVPVEALAGVNYDSLMKLEKLRYIASLSGMEDGAAGWHTGMGVTSSMNARQVEEALEELMKETLLPALRQAEDLYAHAVQEGVAPQSVGKLRELVREMRLMEDAVDACLDTVSYQRGYIYHQSEYLKADVYPTEQEKERVAYSVLTGVDKLENAIAQAAKQYAEWLANAKRYYALVFEDAQGTQVSAQPSGSVQAQIVRMRTARMNALSARAHDLTGKEVTNEQDIVVDVVTVDEVRVYARASRDEYLPGAKVWMWKNGSPQGEPKITNAEGYVSFATASFAPDEDMNIDIGYEIQLDGYRTHYAAPNWHKGGDIVYANMVPFVEGEDTYVAGVSLNGRDALWDEKTVYITPANDANQTLTLELRSQKTGGAPMEASALTLRYETEKGVESRPVTCAAGKTRVDVVDLWCQKLLPGQSSAFTLDLPGGGTMDIPLKTQKAMTQEPQYIKNAQVLTYFAIPGISMTIPGNIPVLSGANLTLNLPFPKFTAYFNIDGDWMIGFGGDENKLNKKLEESLSKWKTADQHAFDEITDAYAKATGKSAKEASKDVMRQANDGLSRKLFLGGVKSYWSINGMAGGHVAPGDKTKNTSSVLISFMVGLKGNYNWIYFIPTPAPIPIELQYGFSLAGGAMVKTTATYVGPPVPEIPVLFMPPVFEEWKFTSFDVNLLLSASLTLSAGIGSSIRGTKYLRLGVGVRGTALASVTIPLLPGSVRQDDFTFEFCAKASVYVDILFLTMTFDIVKGSVAYENKKWGDWKWEFGWKTASMSRFEGADKARLLAAGNADDPYFPDFPETEGDFEVDHSFRGKAEWTYSPYSSGSQPYYFKLRFGGVPTESTFSVWVEDEKTVKCANLDTYAPVTHTLALPAEVQRALDVGAWKVISVRASASPEIHEVDINYGGVSIRTEDIQVGAISVVCATEWETQEVELTDGIKTTMEVPTKTTVVSMLVWGHNDSLYTLDFYDEKTGIRTPAVFVIPMEYGITDVMPMPINIRLKQPPLAGRPDETVCIVPDRFSGMDYYVMHVGTDAVDGESCYFVQHAPDDEGVRDVAIRWLDYETRPVKMIASGGGIVPVTFVLTEDGILSTVSAARTLDEVYQLRNITDFTVITTASRKNESADLTIFCLVEEEEGTRLKGVTATIGLQGTLDDMSVTDYDVQINAGCIFSGELLGEDYVYWFEQGTEGTRPDQKTMEEPVTLVKAFCYAPARDLTTDPFIMGKLVGSDGQAPEGYDFASQPLVAQAVPERGEIMITKEWLRESSDGMSAVGIEPRYTTYTVKTAKQIINEIVGAVSENPAVTAGRSGNIEFTVANQGNTPIVGYDMDVYWRKDDRQRVRIETVHVDLLDPSQNYVIHMEDDIPDAVSASAVYAQNGENGVRRIDSLFDADNADAWNVTRASDRANAVTNELVQLPVLMPTGVHTYMLSYNVPATWSGKHRLEIEIVQAYIPLKVSSLFSGSTASSGALTAGTDSIVLAVRDNPNSENAMLSIAGTVRGFLPVSEAQMIIGAATQKEMMKRLGITDMKYEGGNDELLFDTAELTTDCRLFEEDGQTYVTFSILREGETDNTAVRGVTVSAWLPGESSPTFKHTFRTAMTGREVAYHLTVPVTKLTRGRNADVVYIAASDTVDGNEEMTDINNVRKLVLNMGLKLTRQPEPVTVTEGEDTLFSVTASGGKAPYAYQWQRKMGGVWQNIPEGRQAELYLTGVTLDMNGQAVRCVVSDADGDSIVSDAAVLTVQKRVIPPTGDEMPVAGLTAAAVCALALLMLLLRRRKA